MSLRARIERLENGGGKNDPYAGLAQRLCQERREADERQAKGLPLVEGESRIERYHRIKFSEDPVEKAEAARLRKLFWPHLHR